MDKTGMRLDFSSRSHAPLTLKAIPMRMNRTACILAFPLAIAALSGCASITQGTTQTLIFTMEPTQARCSLTRDGDGELGTVSGSRNTITVSKDKDDIVIACHAEGYEPKTMRLVSSAQAAGIVGGAFLDLGVTDLITGAMWKYPGEVSIVMDPTQAGSAHTTKNSRPVPAGSSASTRTTP